MRKIIIASVVFVILFGKSILDLINQENYESNTNLYYLIGVILGASLIVFLIHKLARWVTPAKSIGYNRK